MFLFKLDKKYKKTDFLAVIFSDQYRPTMDELQVGSLMEIVIQHDLDSNEGGEVILWVSMVKIKIIDSFKVDNDTKINAKNQLSSCTRYFF